MLYAFLRFVARVALRWYYRSIEVVDAGNVPARGAVLLAANHPNAMVDALLVMTTLSRPVRLTAKATLLDHPVTRAVVTAMGIVPLRRASDEQGKGSGVGLERNRGAFDEVERTLGTGGAVLIFPEGRSHSEPALASLRTGCARIALQARANGTDPLVIVPVGLLFERKDRPRTRVAIHYGAPIRVFDAEGPVPYGVEALLARIEVGLRSVTLNFDSVDEAREVLLVSRSLAAVLDRLRPLDEAEPPLSSTISVARRVKHASDTVTATADERALAAAAAFVARLHALRARLGNLGIAMTELWLTPTTGSGILFVLRELGLGLIAAPVALVGRAAHLAPLRLATWVARRSSSSPEEPAMRAIVGGLIAVIITYAVVAVVAARFVDPVVVLGILLALPIASLVDIVWSQRFRRALRRARAFVAFRADPVMQRELVNEAAALRAEAERLELLLGRSP